MGTNLNDNILHVMLESDRRKLGKRGLTAKEADGVRVKRLERHIHDQFSGWCARNEISVWHANPVMKSSIRAGLPDFLLLKNGRALLIEFKMAGNTTSAIQRKIFAELQTHGNHVHVITEGKPGEAYSTATTLAIQYFNI